MIIALAAIAFVAMGMLTLGVLAFLNAPPDDGDVILLVLAAFVFWPIFLPLIIGEHLRLSRDSDGNRNGEDRETGLRPKDDSAGRKASPKSPRTPSGGPS